MTISNNRISISGEKVEGLRITGAKEFPGGTKIFGLRQLRIAIYSTFFDKSECSDKHFERAGGQKEKVHMVTRPSIKI